MKQSLWISFDLGIDGDYGNLYSWLDSHKAVECGDSLAYIKQYEYEVDIIKVVKDDLIKSVKIRDKDRIYLIFEKEDKRIAGKFIFGGRKPPQWEGYAALYEEGAVDEA